MKKIICILYDPLPFDGGSKIATRHMIEQTNNNVVFHILSADLASWKQGKIQSLLNENCLNLHRLYCPSWLQKKSQGAGYWLKQGIYLLNLLFCFSWLLLKRNGRPEKILLISNPSVDLAGYFFTYIVRFFISFSLIQFIHGGIVNSRTSSWCLKQYELTFYLASLEARLKTQLGIEKNNALPDNFQPFTNGIAQKKWPSSKKESQEPIVLWASSLIKWKGLELFIEACQLAKRHKQFTTKICYIRPKNSYTTQSDAPIALSNTLWFESPKNLDQIRASASIFVSTSQNEPFGLSILEALAAGLIVILPKDGSYWDCILSDKKTCLKYEANCSTSLAVVLLNAIENVDQFSHIASQGRAIAEHYHAEKTYQEITKSILSRPRQMRAIA